MRLSGQILVSQSKSVSVVRFSPDKQQTVHQDYLELNRSVSDATEATVTRKIFKNADRLQIASRKICDQNLATQI